MNRFQESFLIKSSGLIRGGLSKIKNIIGKVNGGIVRADKAGRAGISKIVDLPSNVGKSIIRRLDEYKLKNHLKSFGLKGSDIKKHQEAWKAKHISNEVNKAMTKGLPGNDDAFMDKIKTKFKKMIDKDYGTRSYEIRKIKERLVSQGYDKDKIKSTLKSLLKNRREAKKLKILPRNTTNKYIGNTISDRVREEAARSK